MHKPSNRVVEQIASILIAVMFVSAFSTYIQVSSAQQTIKSKDELKTQIDEEIEAHKVKIKNLELKKFSEQEGSFSDKELVKMLSAVGFEGKALKVAWAVVKKESNGRPLAFNGNVKTGDNSYGIFQINMIGGLGVARRDKFDLDSNKDLFDPVVNAQIAYYMSNEGSDWSSWGVGKFPYNGNTEQSNFNLWITKFPEGVF
jgi:cation transport regulator ChaB